MQRKKSLPVNALSNWLALSVTVFISIILTPFLISLLGDRLYGVWMLLVSFVAVYGILDLGVSSAIGRFISFYLGKEEEDGARQVFSSALVLFIFIGAILISATYYLSSNLSNFFNIDAALQYDFELALTLISYSVALTLINNAFSASLRAHEEFVLYNVIKVIAEIARFLMIYKFVNDASPIVTLASVTLISIIFQSIFFWFVSVFYIKTKLFSLRAVNKKAMREITFFAMPVALTIFSEMLRTRLDSIVIAKYLLISEVTIYTIGSRFIVFLSQFMISLSGVLDPRFAFLAGKNATRELTDLYRKAFELLSYTSLGVGFLLIWMGPGLIHAWVGVGYQSSYSVLVVLAFGQALAATQMPGISLLFAVNRHHILSILVLVEGSLNLFLSIYFVKKWGVNGVAVGTLIPIVLVKVLFLPYLLTKILDIKLSIIIKPLVKGIISYTILFFLLRHFQPQSLDWAGVFLWGGVSTVLLSIFTAVVLLSKEGKEALLVVVKSLYSTKATGPGNILNQ